jgi:septum formation protein
MFQTLAPLILASGSPRRRKFLSELGLVFTVGSADLDESSRPGELPGELVCRLAGEKAAVVAVEHPKAWVIGADTVVVLGGAILGKPADQAEALAMLGRLNGRTHQVWSGVAITNLHSRVSRAFAVCTEVSFAETASAVLAAYVATGEPLDKAGAYGIQGQGVFLVDSIRGSYSNVVGLPLPELLGQLLELGIIAPVDHPPQSS